MNVQIQMAPKASSIIIIQYEARKELPNSLAVQLEQIYKRKIDNYRNQLPLAATFHHQSF